MILPIFLRLGWCAISQGTLSFPIADPKNLTLPMSHQKIQNIFIKNKKYDIYFFPRVIIRFIKTRQMFERKGNFKILILIKTIILRKQ